MNTSENARHPLSAIGAANGPTRPALAVTGLGDGGSTSEEWRDIPGYGGKYEASSLGRVRRGGRVLVQSKHRKGYMTVGLNNRTVSVHRVVAYAFFGFRDSKSVVDHINHDRADNRAENLRYCAPSQNLHRQHKPRGKVPYFGVWRSCNGKFSASIRENGASMKLGTFATAEEAARAYDAAALRIHGKYANLNFPASNELEAA